MKPFTSKWLYVSAAVAVIFFLSTVINIEAADTKAKPPTATPSKYTQEKNSKTAIVRCETVKHMVSGASLAVGNIVSTKGYYLPGDGGQGTYAVRAKNVDDVDNGGKIILLDNGNVAELITDETVNVKQFGAKGDGITDDTVAFQNMFSANYKKFYIPKGDYSVNKQICNYKLNPLAHDIEIFGDGSGQTKLKLQDNVITGDGQRLFTIMAAEGNAFTVCLHDMHIDMNRTNNHGLVDVSGDRYALQHCHAIGVYPADNAPATVLAYNLSFFDLIGDGLGLSGNSTQSYDTVTVHDIVSKGRKGTRSDICLTGDFNSVTVYDCDLDSLETEVNRPAAGRKRRFSANNVVTRQRLDFGAKKDVEDGNRWEYTINNVVSSSLMALRFCKCTYFNCKFELGKKFVVADSDAYFTGCEIGMADNYVYGDTQRGLITATNKQNSSLHFNHCTIKFSGSKPLIYKEAPVNLARHDRYGLSFDSCSIDATGTASDVCLVRAGDVMLINNRIKLNGYSFVSFGKILSDIHCESTGNSVTGNGYILTPPIESSNNSGFSLVSKNNSTQTLGNAVNFTRYDKLTARRGGSGNLVDVLEIDELRNGSEPTTGKWIKGQKVYNSNPATKKRIKGWVCTKSGHAGNAKFSQF